MRIDLFLSTTNVTKRRSISADMCDNNVVFINAKLAQKSSKVKVGDKISLKLLDKTREFEVLKIPEKKSIPKDLSAQYVKEI
ncbi:MAG: RNA-binding S4 domain-containing protein [Helicobacter sp.]|nr:RNA-binding S4 domain-containing protein [Helicobacter sp.]